MALSCHGHAMTAAARLAACLRDGIEASDADSRNGAASGSSHTWSGRPSPRTARRADGIVGPGLIRTSSRRVRTGAAQVVGRARHSPRIRAGDSGNIRWPGRLCRVGFVAGESIADIYLGAGEQDLPATDRLAGELRARGIPVRWTADLKPGSDWRTHLQRARGEAAAVVFLLSRTSAQISGLKEAVAAASAGELVLVTLDDVDASTSFPSVVAVNLRDWNSGERDPNFEVLVGLLSERLPSDSTPEKAGHGRVGRIGRNSPTGHDFRAPSVRRSLA